MKTILCSCSSSLIKRNTNAFFSKSDDESPKQTYIIKKYCEKTFAFFSFNMLKPNKFKSNQPPAMDVIVPTD